MSDVIIENWNGSAEHSHMFGQLNREWLEEFFWVEPTDEAMFADPKAYIVDKGGDILFARVNGDILGVIALLPLEDGVYELSKMGVTGRARGMGIGRKLGEALIALARKQGVKKLYIASNRKLEQAITLYKKLGFVELPHSADPRYQRADITLELPLTDQPMKRHPDPTRYGDWELMGKCVDF
jgi:GNAT superfamily N-acetyltransferase